MDSFAIQSTDLSKNYGDKVAVNKVNLAVKKGEIYAFLGPNGAGKSTTVKILTTLSRPTSGSANVGGHDIVKERTSVKLNIGVALQEASLDAKQSGRELLTLQGRLYGMSKEQIKDRISELEKLVDIGPDFDKFVGTYSGGMKRRLDLALSIIHLPRVLFLDEPTTGLDPISRRSVWEQIRQINKENDITIFLTTQYLEEADYMADKVGIIAGGKIVIEGTPAELKHSMGGEIIIVKFDDSIAPEMLKELGQIPGIDEVATYKNELSLKTKNGAANLSKVAIKLDQMKVNVQEFSLRGPSLDDVFLKYTGARLDDVPSDQDVSS